MTKSDALGYFLSEPRGLGGARTGIQFWPLTPVISDAIPPLIIERVRGENGAGTGTLRAYGSSMASWEAPGDDEGAQMAIPANTRVLLESDDTSKSIVVYRDSEYDSEDIEGAMTVELVPGMNNAVGLDNITTAGAKHYGFLWLVNQSDEPITELTVTGTGDYTVGTEEPDGGEVQEIADNETAPIGITFAASVDISRLDPDEYIGLWVKRDADAGSVSAEETATINVTWLWAGASYSDTLTGEYRVADSSLDRYEFFLGVDDDPDFTASPEATSATLPFTVAATVDAENRYAVRKRNSYDLESFNVLASVTNVGAGGEDETPVLTDPEMVSLTAAPGGEADLRLKYNGAADDTEADTWRLYITTNGTDPDPATDSPSDTSMKQIGLARPVVEAILNLGPYDYGTDLRVIARVYSTTLDDESNSTEVHTLDIDTQKPVGGHLYQPALGGYRAVTPDIYSATVYYDDPTDSIGLKTLDGEVILFAGSVDVLRGERGALDFTRTPLLLKQQAHSASGNSAPIEVVSANEIYINVNGTRRVKIDLANDRIEAATFEQVSTPLDVPVIGPFHMTDTNTYIQVRDRYTGRWTPAIAVNSSGKMTFTAPIKQDLAS